MHEVTAYLISSAQWCVQISAYVLLATSFIGLGLAVFQLAFLVAPLQIMTRAVLQILLLQIGSELVMCDRATNHSMRLLLTTCAIVTGTIGLVIGNLELSSIEWNAHLMARMGLYLLLLIGGNLLSPMTKSSELAWLRLLLAEKKE